MGRRHVGVHETLYRRELKVILLRDPDKSCYRVIKDDHARKIGGNKDARRNANRNLIRLG